MTSVLLLVFWFWCICNHWTLKAFSLNEKMRLLCNDVITDAGGGRLVKIYLPGSPLFFLMHLTIQYPLAIKWLTLYRSEANVQRPRTTTITQGQ